MRRFLPSIRRTSVRHSVRLPCQIVRERDFRMIAENIVDMSQGGVLVGPAAPVLTGERVLVSFQVPGIEGFWIDVDATVARVVHGRRPGEYMRGLGLMFDDLPPFAELILRQALQFVPCTPPGSRLGRRRSSAIVPALLRSRVRPPALPFGRPR
jgi:hypothetical protein